MAVKRTARGAPRRVAKIRGPKRRRGAIKISARKKDRVSKKKRVQVPAYGRDVRRILKDKRKRLHTMTKNKWVNGEMAVARGIVLATLYHNAAFFTCEDDFRACLKQFKTGSQRARAKYDRTKNHQFVTPKRKFDRMEELRDQGVQAAMSTVYARDLFTEITDALKRPTRDDVEPDISEITPAVLAR